METTEFIYAFLQEVLVQAMPVIVALIVGVLAKLASGIWKDIQANKPDLAEYLQYAAAIGYAAAEKAGIEQLAKDKKAYAIQKAQEFLNTRHIKIDVNVISDAIEAYGVANNLFEWTKEKEPENKIGFVNETPVVKADHK